MEPGTERLPTGIGEIHLGMALERVLTAMGNVLFEEFPFIGGTTCIQQTLDPARSPFAVVTYCFADEKLFSIIWQRATTSPLDASIARYGPPTTQRVDQRVEEQQFSEHRWRQGDLEYIVTQFVEADGARSYSVEICDAAIKRSLPGFPRPVP